MEDILSFINKKIREEHGLTVYSYSQWEDADLDSYGSTVVFLELDEKYGCFDKDWLSQVNWQTLSIQDLINRIRDEGRVV